MTIKEIVKAAAGYLGDADVYDYLKDNDMFEKADKSLLIAIDDYTRCANVIINELATSFVPMIKKEMFTSREVKFSDFSERVLKIKNITDEKGNELSYKCDCGKIASDVQPFVVEYSFLPPNYGFCDEVVFSRAEVTAAFLGLGVAAEICLLKRAFDESVFWRKRYSSFASGFMSPKNVSTKKRRWI